MTTGWPKSVKDPLYQGTTKPVLEQAEKLYPARFYARIDNSVQPSPVTGWVDVWGLSSIDDMPPAAALVPLTEEQWDFHLQTDENGSHTHLSAAVENGEFIDYTPPPPPPPPLREQARPALAAARQYVSENYTMINEETPQEWVDYLKKLMAIASGRDTTSTALPSPPEDLT